jgi:hypothetical protein
MPGVETCNVGRRSDTAEDGEWDEDQTVYKGCMARTVTQTTKYFQNNLHDKLTGSPEVRAGYGAKTALLLSERNSLSTSKSQLAL